MMDYNPSTTRVQLLLQDMVSDQLDKVEPLLPDPALNARAIVTCGNVLVDVSQMAEHFNVPADFSIATRNLGKVLMYLTSPVVLSTDYHTAKQAYLATTLPLERTR